MVMYLFVVIDVQLWQRHFLHGTVIHRLVDICCGFYIDAFVLLLILSGKDGELASAGNLCHSVCTVHMQ